MNGYSSNEQKHLKNNGSNNLIRLSILSNLLLLTITTLSLEKFPSFVVALTPYGKTLSKHSLYDWWPLHPSISSTFHDVSSTLRLSASDRYTKENEYVKDQQRQPLRHVLGVETGNVVEWRSAAGTTTTSPPSLEAATVTDTVTTLLERSFPAVVGHRGCPYDALENTREGFQLCLDMGCDGIELDVFALKCGTLVVFHGGGTDKNPGLLHEYLVGKNITPNSSILDYTYTEVLQQDWKFNVDYPELVCSNESVQRGVISTLDQVLSDIKKVSSDMHVTIELKGGNDVVQHALSLVESMEMVSQTTFSSFQMKLLEQVRTLRPKRDLYRIGVLFNDFDNEDDILAQAQVLQADEIHLRYDTCTVDFIETIHRRGFGSMAWFRGPSQMSVDCETKYWDVGNEDEAMYLAMIQTGVQRMCVNKPRILLGIRDSVLLERGGRLN